MGRVAAKGNSLDSELEAFDAAFAKVEYSAAEYQAHEAGGKDKLYDALSEVFSFGEDLAARPDHNGRNVLDAFLERKNANKAARKNPYLPLVKLAFGNLSASSASQYAVVLKHAHVEKLPVDKFRSWLSEAGIKDRHKAAVQHFGSVGHRRSEERRLSRLEAGRRAADQLEISEPFKFKAPQEAGYMSVLVRVGDDGNAVVVDKLDADIDALLRRYAPKAASKHHLADKPLFALYRAIDTVLRLTPAAPQGCNRDVLVTTERSLAGPIVRVQSASAAYSYTWASTVIEGGVPGLLDRALVIATDEASEFCGSFEQADWSLQSSEGEAELVALPPVTRPLRLQRLSSGSYFVAADLTDTRPVSLSQERAESFLREWDALRERHRKRQQRSISARALPRELAISWAAGVLSVGDPNGPERIALFDAASWHLASGERWIAVDDLLRVCDVAHSYEVDLQGTIVDGTSPELGLRLSGNLGSDRLTVVVPFVIGRAGQLAQTNRRLELPTGASATA